MNHIGKVHPKGEPHQATVDVAGGIGRAATTSFGEFHGL